MRKRKDADDPIMILFMKNSSYFEDRGKKFIFSKLKEAVFKRKNNV